jgi:hypothetical protein
MGVLKRQNVFVGPTDPKSDILVGPGGHGECGNLPTTPRVCPECGSTEFNGVFCSSCNYATSAAKKSLERAKSKLKKRKK